LRKVGREPAWDGLEPVWDGLEPAGGKFWEKLAAAVGVGGAGGDGGACGEV